LIKNRGYMIMQLVSSCSIVLACCRRFNSVVVWHPIHSSKKSAETSGERASVPNLISDFFICNFYVVGFCILLEFIFELITLKIIKI